MPYMYPRQVGHISAPRTQPRSGTRGGGSSPGHATAPGRRTLESCYTALPQPVRQPVARPKVKAYIMRPGVNQAIRTPADAAWLPPPPPPPQQIKVSGGVQTVGIASVPISLARGSYGTARVSVVGTPPPPPPPPVGATPPHAVPGGRLLLLLLRQWGLRPRMRFRGGRFRDGCSLLLLRQWGLRPRMRSRGGRFHLLFR